MAPVDARVNRAAPAPPLVQTAGPSLRGVRPIVRMHGQTETTATRVHHWVFKAGRLVGMYGAWWLGWKLSGILLE
jgi:hypothetical protein